MEFLIYLIIVAITIAGMWKMFEKAGEEGWKAIVPIYNIVVTLRIVGKPWWWVLLMLIPWVGMIWTVWATNLLSKSFGKGVITTLGLIFVPFVFYPLLGFGPATFRPLKKEKGSMADTMHKVVDDVEQATKDVEATIVDVAHKVEEKFGEKKEEVKEEMEK